VASNQTFCGCHQDITRYAVSRPFESRGLAWMAGWMVFRRKKMGHTVRGANGYVKGSELLDHRPSYRRQKSSHWRPFLGVRIRHYDLDHISTSSTSS
jgi:hypothetical protein